MHLSTQQLASPRITMASSFMITLSSTPFLVKPKHFPTIKKPHKILCKSTDNDQESQQPSKFDRRNILIGLGGLYGASTLATAPMALSDPVSVPDVSVCGPVHLPPTPLDPTHCCPPSLVRDFKLPTDPPAKLRTRPAAHLIDDIAYIKKFETAIKRMRALPDDDPRSFKQQANVHCAYCDAAYYQVGLREHEIQVHSSWLFFPFHRWYLYFFERILGKLIDDPNFAMPFWNWDAPKGMYFPEIYKGHIFEELISPLYDAYRNRQHVMRGTVIDLNYNRQPYQQSDPQIQELALQQPDPQIQKNLNLMYSQMVSANTPSLFFGSEYRLGDDPNPGPGSLESAPHNTVHDWTGDPETPNHEDMGSFYSAARDPVFYAHHSNVDRMWNLWKTLKKDKKKRKDIADPDYLDASFIFYDENRQMVRVKVRDCLDTKLLGYDYQDMSPLPWLHSRPQPRVSREPGAKKDEAGSPAEVLPANLDRVLKVTVKRPKKNRSKEEKDEKEEILVIKGIELDGGVYAKFDVHINDDNEDLTTEEHSEFVGTFVNLPHGKNIKTQLRLSITDALEDLQAEGDDTVLVSLVPKAGGDSVTINDVTIELGN